MNLWSVDTTHTPQAAAAAAAAAAANGSQLSQLQ